MNNDLLKAFDSILNINDNKIKLQNIIDIINYRNNTKFYIFRKLNINEILDFLIIYSNQSNYIKFQNYIENLNIIEPSLLDINIHNIKYRFCIGLVNDKILIFGYMWSYLRPGTVNSSYIHSFLHTNSNEYHYIMNDINNNSNLEFLHDELFKFPNIIL